jgi:Uma2 family endonuclease
VDEEDRHAGRGGAGATFVHWVVDASSEVVEIHRGPAAGGYGETRRLIGGATVSPQAFPDIALPLVEIFA